MKPNLSRKNFLKVSSLGAAGAIFTTNPLLASTGSTAQQGTKKTAPSDIVNVATVGCSRQGREVSLGFMASNDVRLIANCDVYDLKKQEFKTIVEDEYVYKNMAVKGYKTYEYFEEMLENKDIDAVIIATPDHWHALMGVAACQAGKDIYVEKPMAFTVYEGEQLVKAVRKYSRIMQTGSMQRSNPNFEQMAKIAHSGVMGKISTIYAPVGDPPHEIDYEEQPVPAGLNWDKWLGPLSTKFYFNEELNPRNSRFGGWRWHKGLGGGYTTDWGAHMFDCAQWAIGKDGNGPISVVPPEESKYNKLTYVYDNGIEMIQSFDPWDGDRGKSVKIFGENGWILASRNSYYCSNPEWSMEGQDDSNMPPPPSPRAPRPPAAATATAPTPTVPQPNDLGVAPRSILEVYQKHYRSFIDGIKTRIDPNTPVETGQSSAVLCNIGNIAYDLKRTLTWNPLIDQFMNDDEANNFRIMKYKMRDPYQIDNI